MNQVQLGKIKPDFQVQFDEIYHFCKNFNYA